ncbi:MAG: tRNA (adenosine(37)-N6)-threonylcarbamoyltransferase complex dimerization subunit type 1 TsaB [Planctomycetaceae bacterium]|nr:tRNA (adenosine(37)-N6)-threonylcarbamoyltransferase complex dimerization subunit type 1 TsaB [Planctomycetaceae bacterium]
MSLLTLGVETSGLTGAVVLRRDGETIESVAIQQAGRRHAQTLVSEVDALLRRANLTAKQLQVVAVSVGPGSFTGLRVGVVFAKTLAYAVGCRLIAVDTFRAIAAASPSDVTDVFIVSDAQRGELFVGRYSCAYTATVHTSPIRLGEISIESADSFCRRAGEVSVSGPAAAILPTTMRVLVPEFHLPRAEFIAALGEQQALAGEQSDLWQLEPFYLRRSAAEEKAAS